tara:strand:+ start:298 stop:900 length:603 start_codon:yes stop_codon:yes gene_type:complete
MHYKQLEKVLKHSGVDTNISELKQGFELVKLVKGQHFIRQGEIENRIAFICEGYLRYYYITFSGDDVTKHFAFENDFAASYASLIYQKPTAYNIVAEEDCVLLVMYHDAYKENINTYRKWERVARLYTENIYNLKEIREAALLLMDAKDRYVAFIEQYPNAESRMKQKHIATYLGIHPVSLSRIKKDLKKDLKSDDQTNK